MRDNLRDAAMVAVTFAIGLIVFVTPAGAQTAAPKWTATRPIKALSATVSAPQLEPVPAAARISDLTTNSSDGWTDPIRLKDTSTHLRWGSKSPSTTQSTTQSAAQPKQTKLLIKSTNSKSTNSTSPTALSPRMANRRASELPRRLRPQAKNQPLAQPRSVLANSKKPTETLRLIQNMEDVRPDFGVNDLIDGPSQLFDDATDPLGDEIFSAPAARPVAPEPAGTEFKDMTPSTDNTTAAQELQQPLLLPEPIAPPMLSPAASDRSNSAEDDSEDINETLRNQLEQLQKLPPVPAADRGATEILPERGEVDNDNPLALFGDQLDAESQKDDSKGIGAGELAATNDRDCAAQAASCQADFDKLLRRERLDMSLDITPSIDPSETDMAVVEESRIEKLAEAPSRRWRDRAGNVIADGKFDDYVNGNVMVRTVNGTVLPLPDYTLSDADRCFVTAWWELPEECNFEGEQYVMRDFRLTTFTWTAAATCHKPLYFEEVAVERYGHSSGPIVQPLVSGAHFFGNILALPYHAGLTPPNECLYTLGHYRPGNCAPWLMPGFPFTTRGFKFEGLALAAAIALLP